MREHQIVITLKPDQFLEVQRLARAANAKSMGVFVRQKLLAALGIEGSLQTEIPTADVDIEALRKDLSRLHGELKSFVAESLSLYADTAFLHADMIEDSSQQLSLFEQSEDLAPHAVQEPFPQNDDMEHIAEKAFAISPRLGQIGQVSAPLEPVPSPCKDETERTASSEISQTIASSEVLARHDLHSRRDVRRQLHMGAEVTDDINALSNERESIKSHADDGPPAKPAQTMSDPLSKLLSCDELAARPLKPGTVEDDDDFFDVPLSLAMRRRQLETQAVVENTTIEAPTEAVTAQEPDDSEVFSALTGEQLNVDTGDGNGEGGSPASSAPPSALPKDETNQPLGYPNLSGSPPPKRRQV